MADDLDDIECVAMVLVDRFGRAAARFVRDQAEMADALPDIASAETWQEIARAIERTRRVRCR
jgi:hypothetical protein